MRKRLDGSVGLIRRGPATTVWRVWAVLFVTSIATGCAKVKVDDRDVLAPLDGLPKPPVALIYDFAVDANDVIVDTFGPRLFSGKGAPSERLEFARRVQTEVAQTLTRMFNEKGLPARRARPDARASLHALMIKGQFVTVDEGDTMGRVVIGFGRGKTEMRVRLQVYQMTSTGPRQLIGGGARATGSKRPGLLVPIAGGAAAGAAATSAVVSGSVTVVSEVKGAIKGDIDRLAEEITERAVQFYIDRGWATDS